MDGVKYDFHNTGFKLHLPVVPDENDPLTKKIITFLDNKFGLNVSDRYKQRISTGYSQYQTPCYKIGWCSDALEDGKGMTVYGKVSSIDEMQKLSQEIEKQFGKELADNVKKHGIVVTSCDTQLTPNVSYRFAGYGFKNDKMPHGFGCNGLEKPFMDYNHSQNPSNALTRTIYKDKDGVWHTIAPYEIGNMSAEQKMFLNGDSTLASIDNFGELFTGKIENGKVPQRIMDGLPKEYLQHYNLSEKDIVARIQNGTKQITANMLEDLANNGANSALLRKGATPWLTTLEPQALDEAKQLLAKFDPQAVQKLEQVLPQLEKTCPALSVLAKTTPLAKMNGTVSKPTSVHNPTVPNAGTKPNTPVTSKSVTAGENWFKKLPLESKVGIGAIGTGLATFAIYSLVSYALRPKNSNKSLIDTSNTEISPQQAYINQPFNQYYPVCNYPMMSGPMMM